MPSFYAMLFRSAAVSPLERVLGFLIWPFVIYCYRSSLTFTYNVKCAWLGMPHKAQDKGNTTLQHMRNNARIRGSWCATRMLASLLRARKNYREVWLPFKDTGQRTLADTCSAPIYPPLCLGTRGRWPAKVKQGLKRYVWFDRSLTIVFLIMICVLDLFHVIGCSYNTFYWSELCS